MGRIAPHALVCDAGYPKNLSPSAEMRGAKIFNSAKVEERLLFGVKPVDPITFASVAAVVLIAAAMASLIPARRATTVDPVVALRWE